MFTFSCSNKRNSEELHGLLTGVAALVMPNSRHTSRQLEIGQEVNVEEISDGWLLSTQTRVNNGDWSGIGRSITGWSPRDNLYHTLTSTVSSNGSRCFSEATMAFNPETEIWEKEYISISDSNYFTKGTGTTVYKGDVAICTAFDNFANATATLRRVK